MEPAGIAGMRWINDPVRHEDQGHGALLIGAGPRTDLFRDPGGDEPTGNAPMLVGEVDGDHLLSATVGLEFASDFDAGALVVYASETRWAKLAFERSPRGRPTIVTVVTDGVSDDANAMEVDAATVDLRIARVGDTHAFHVRRDGVRWDLVRYFALGGPCETGLLAQSPTGDGVDVRFTDVRVVHDSLQDLRNGT